METSLVDVGLLVLLSKNLKEKNSYLAILTRYICMQPEALFHFRSSTLNHRDLIYYYYFVTEM